MWLIYSFSAAIFESSKDYLIKKYNSTTKILERILYISFYSTLILVILLVFIGIPEIDWKPFLLVSISNIIISPLHLYFYFKSLQQSEISDVIPLTAFIPVFTLFISIFLLDNSPQILPIIGLFIVVVGLYFSNSKNTKNLIHPIKGLFGKVGNRYMLIACIALAFGITLGKVRVDASSPIMSAFTNSLITFVTMNIFYLVKNKKLFNIINLKKLFSIELVIGILDGLSSLSTGYALISGYAPFVSSIKRTNIIASQFSGWILLKEKMTTLKLIGNLIVFIGVMLIVLN